MYFFNFQRNFLNFGLHNLHSWHNNSTRMILKKTLSNLIKNVQNSIRHKTSHHVVGVGLILSSKSKDGSTSSSSVSRAS